MIISFYLYHPILFYLIDFMSRFTSFGQKTLKFAKELLKYLLIFIVVYGAINYWRQATMPETPILHVQDIDHNSLDLIQLSHEQAVMIYFWGSWCHVCQHSTPNIQQLARETPVITIAVQSGNDAEIRQYLQQYGYRFTTINDEDGILFQQWQGKVTPSYLILKDGKMQQSFVGLQPLWLLKLRMKWANFNTSSKTNLSSTS